MAQPSSQPRKERANEAPARSRVRRGHRPVGPVLQHAVRRRTDRHQSPTMRSGCWTIPRVNFAISTRGGQTGLDHLGIQVETQDELQEVYGRLQQADRPVLEEGATTCCYAQSEKSWITDPQGRVMGNLPDHRAKARFTATASISARSAARPRPAARLKPRKAHAAPRSRNRKPMRPAAARLHEGHVDHHETCGRSQ